VEAWVLVEVTHKPSPVVDEQGTPTGDWELVSSGKWKRDPDVPTPDRVVVVREQLDDEQTA